jgi:hypothetical protein
VAVKEMPNMLLVRARKREDLHALVEDSQIVHTPNRDYPYRVIISRGEVMLVLLQVIRNMEYTNFKDSVSDPRLHDAYYKVWSVMLDEYQTEPSLYKH